MATGADQVVGVGIVGLSGIIFTYYTLWLVILPFVDSDHVVQNFFPDRIYAVTIPVAAGVLLLVVLCAFIAVAKLKSKSKEKTN
ncbi:dolichol phosphate-mannose biosynthesis regulatory protein [Lingula anatina]|uniref:Dolichol phosphate-mannose biosynthesis regulatory protein n=1 Tax=Lingula anatina TaxID=7574 RepID=A0A1S3JBS7_LINAN|nr:dolichol phosphate-mannose biosynthesis regulatory protein [Lingula anatina]|eukprot:XP_013407641.1 dolichol phosphate-mannose biosynthesis regulatory protein [Lingula anatina]